MSAAQRTDYHLTACHVELVVKKRVSLKVPMATKEGSPLHLSGWTIVMPHWLLPGML